MPASRRDFLHATGIALSFAVGGDILRVTAREARAAKLPLQVLGPQQAGTVEAKRWSRRT